MDNKIGFNTYPFDSNSFNRKMDNVNNHNPVVCGAIVLPQTSPHMPAEMMWIYQSKDTHPITFEKLDWE